MHRWRYPSLSLHGELQSPGGDTRRCLCTVSYKVQVEIPVAVSARWVTKSRWRYPSLSLHGGLQSPGGDTRRCLCTVSCKAQVEIPVAVSAR